MYLHFNLLLLLFLVCMRACMPVYSIAKGSCNGFVARCRSDFAALRGSPAMVLFCCIARGCLAMLYLGGFDCEGVLQWFDFTVLREGVAMTPVYKHCNMFGSLG